jgi:hypothetical protein
MSYRGHVQNGAVVLDDAVVLPEGASVHVELVDDSKDSEDAGPTLHERLKPVIGTAKGLPPDAALNVDHYLYGQPKR